MNNEKIGKYLFTKRKEKGITQAELANILGVTYQAVSRWENGDSIPDIQLLDQLADYYDVTIDEILQRKPRQIEVTKEDNTYEQARLMNLLGFILLIGKFLGYGLLILFLDLAVKYATYWYIIGVISLFMFLIASILPINLYYVFETKKNPDATKIYLRYFALFWAFTLVILSIIYIQASYLRNYNERSVFWIWYIVFMLGLTHKLYINKSLSILFKNGFTKKMILPIILTVLFFLMPHFNTSMWLMAIFPCTIIFLYLALK